MIIWYSDEMSSECEENSNKSTIVTELELAWLILLKVSCNRQLGKDHRPLFNIAHLYPK